MGDHHDGDAVVLADPRDQGGDRALVGQVEAVQRLVQQQQPRAGGQRLGDQQALLLTAGQLPDRAVRVRLASTRSMTSRPGPRRRAGGHSSRRAPGSGIPPPVPVETEADDVDPADPQLGVEAAPLRQVADLVVGLPRRAAQDAIDPRDNGNRPRTALISVDLPDPVRAEDGDELAAGAP